MGRTREREDRYVKLGSLGDSDSGGEGEGEGARCAAVVAGGLEARGWSARRLEGRGWGCG